MGRTIRSEYLVLLFSVLMMAGYNQSLWSGIIAANPGWTLHTVLFLASCTIFLTAVFNFLFNIFALGRVLKPVLIVIIICSAAASFFMDSYGVHIDSTMMQNVVETDSSEATELLSPNLILHMLLWAVIPAWLILKVNVQYAGWKKHAIVHLFSMTMSILAIGLVAAFFYADYASTFRNHRDLRYLINPTNYVYAASKTIRQHLPSEEKKITPITQGTKLGAIASSKHHRTIAVMVVGETGRAEEWHLDGYARQTTPELEKLNIINFDHVSSCGTSTAVSLPCMFSVFPRDNYSDEKGHFYENLLDVVSTAGISVLWLDNNSGCKGICQRVKSEQLMHMKLPEVCNAEECFDDILIKRLQQAINSNNEDMLVVLHQKGSHGPAYYKRVPDAFKKFSPMCETSELPQCSRESIINAYDNTILYTDKVLSEVVNLLQDSSDQNDTAMMYVSDHGESLGEHNMYLHGTPYMFAPSQQTHVPMIVWLSDSYKEDYHVDESCLLAEQHQPLSHDNIFHSLLGLMNIELPEGYDSKLDIFASCHQSYHPQHS